MTQVYVVDTGYMLELFGVPGWFDVSTKKEIARRFKEAFENSCRIYVPFPCICELGNLIAQVSDGEVRRNLALKLLKSVKSSLSEGVPWIITPSEGVWDIEPICKAWANQHVARTLSLTDTVVVEEAKRLRRKYSGLGYKVHIWTKDAPVKALEPDKEEGAFLGYNTKKHS